LAVSRPLFANLTALLIAIHGSALRLRLAEVDTQDLFQTVFSEMGVDNARRSFKAA
jgi:hypothetical protein